VDVGVGSSAGERDGVDEFEGIGVGLVIVKKIVFDFPMVPFVSLA